jgi:hypothetical protein
MNLVAMSIDGSSDYFWNLSQQILEACAIPLPLPTTQCQFDHNNL